MTTIRRFFLQAERFYHAVDFYLALRRGDWRGRRDANMKISRCDDALFRLEAWKC